MRFVLAVFLCGCGAASPNAPDAGDAGVRYGHKPMDASGGFDVTEEVVKMPWDRLESHGGTVLSAMRLHAIYVTSPSDPAVIKDDLLAWILSSPDYWSLLVQYGVGYGTLIGSSTVDAMTFFNGDIHNGYVTLGAVDWAVANAAATLPPDEGGTPNAFIVFLPGTANVDMGDGPCMSTLGYHSVGGTMPYALIRPCSYTAETISHELAEMATDPIPFAGWYSEADVENAGGEIGDLCNFPTIVDGHAVTELWSNADGQCEPQ